MNYNEASFTNHEVGGGEEMTGNKIKEYLISKGVSQTFVANKTGIPISTLNAALNGNRKMLAEEYFSICQVLGVPLDTFMEEEHTA